MEVSQRSSGNYRFPDLPECRGDHDFNLFIPPCYLLGSIIGEGEFAVVYTAYNLRKKVFVVIKCFRRRSGHYMMLDEQIMREMMAAKGLIHDHIVNVHEAIMYGNRVFLVMEYCANGDLRQYINKTGALSEPRAREFFVQLCLGVRRMHLVDLVHRDLKLENIFIDSKFKLKIGDFGCARRQMDKTLHTITGSYAYGAPELVQGHEYDGKKADVWSMGIILYAMVVGKLPYSDKGSLKQMLKKRLKPPHFPNDISVHCRDLISRMLKYNSSLRLSLEQVMSHPWIMDKDQDEPETVETVMY